MLPILTYQNLLSHMDGSSVLPPITVLKDGKEVSNSDYGSWLSADQRVVIILNASLTEEAVAEVLGLFHAREIWLALESAYSNTYVERMQNLRDQLRQSTKGTAYVADFGRKFKNVCDQLAAIGHPVDETDKVHWFLCGLSASFETFSTAIRTSKPGPAFRDLLS